MNYYINYTDKALNDLETIEDYIYSYLGSPNTAIAQTDRIMDEIDSLQVFPNRNTAVDYEPWRSLNTRKLLVDNFIVFYTVDDEKKIVNILRIVYGRQDLENADA